MSTKSDLLPHEIAEIAKLTRVHSEWACHGQMCVIHNPVDGPWRALPMEWLDEVRSFSRHCEHGQLHPDPSQFAYFVHNAGLRETLDAFSPHHGIGHGCDACCSDWIQIRVHVGYPGAEMQSLEITRN